MQGTGSSFQVMSSNFIYNVYTAKSFSVEGCFIDKLGKCYPISFITSFHRSTGSSLVINDYYYSNAFNSIIYITLVTRGTNTLVNQNWVDLQITNLSTSSFLFTFTVEEFYI